MYIQNLNNEERLWNLFNISNMISCVSLFAQYNNVFIDIIEMIERARITFDQNK
jgi:hypothetical protein